jgi:putative endonuclease
MGKHNETGARGEQFAESYLREQGYEILCRNWRYGHKEIDLIADDKGMLVFVEIKARSGLRFGFPEEAVTLKKQSNMQLAAEAYLEKKPAYRTVRFDVIALLYSGEQVREIRHLVDAF